MSRKPLKRARDFGVDIQDLHNLPVSYELIARAANHQAAMIMREHEEAGRRVDFPFEERLAKWRGPDRPRKMRVGFALPYTFVHSFPLVFKGVVERIDRDRFEVFGYSMRPSHGGEFERKYRATFDHFLDLPPIATEAGARRIYDDELDLLVDVTGHTSINCQGYMSQRPAPVQAHMLGYSITVGKYIDYLITDRVYIPPEMAKYGVEHVAYLPQSSMAPSLAPVAAGRQQRSDHRLPEGAFVFCNFNQPFKFDPSMFALWMRLLRNVENSVLWLGAWSATAMANLLREAAAHGVDPARLVFAPLAPHAKHLARLQLADLALENRYYTGGVTALDALRVGVPILTAVGPTPTHDGGLFLPGGPAQPLDNVHRTIRALEAYGHRRSA